MVFVSNGGFLSTFLPMPDPVADGVQGMFRIDQDVSYLAQHLRENRMIAAWILVAMVMAIMVVAYFVAGGISAQLLRLTNSIAMGSEEITSASGQVASASQSLAQGAIEQASSLEETSASLEEMASMTRQNADIASQANTVAKFWWKHEQDCPCSQPPEQGHSCSCIAVHRLWSSGIAPPILQANGLPDLSPGHRPGSGVWTFWCAGLSLRLRHGQECPCSQPSE